MPRKSANGVNRSKLIRDIKGTDASLKPAAISTILKSEHGLDVSSNYISTVLSQAKSKSTLGDPVRQRGRPPKSGVQSITKEGSKNSHTSDQPSLDNLLKAKEFAKAMGGIEAAKKALDALFQLVG